MSHTIQEKAKLLARVRRIKGQVEAIERALENELGCDPIMHMLAGVRGSIAGMMAEVIEDHVRDHIMMPGLDEAGRREAAEHLIDVVRSYLK
ncbi:metal/formaldehyde-sensitive transcriptional repressor [Labrys sp. ZIDIC5]|uniref:metal/formaldehyde-sensitive transcriptional repressor n=1 Tax=Labrys sedimenti TaxID=3106036 RepID=UPI002ACAAF53|nr:metal/formaldehyde-sensitive transcriptional repressor [Labrys sp. ZIDIC5]MDZ5448699.1 metal/formaldehyde-sensitive transcriptional repressor [Labrys sp. ZIDIC5]